MQVLSDSAPRQDLLFTDFAEKLQVLVHGVHAVSWNKQTLRFPGENRRDLRDVRPQKTLHKLLHQIPAVPRNYASTVLHLYTHTHPVILMNEGTFFSKLI